MIRHLKIFFWSLVLNMYQYIEPFDKYLSFYNQPKFVNGGEQNKKFTAYFNWATQILIDKIVATEYSKSDGDIRECVFDILDILQNSTEMLGEYYFSAIEKLLKKLASGHSGWSESLIYLVEDAHHECPYFYRRIREICESVPGYPCDKNEPPKRIKYTAVPDGHNTVNNQRNNAKLVAEPFFTN